MTLLKSSDYNSREINVALLSLEADIKNKITNFDTSVIDKQLVEINSRIDKINAGSNNTSAEINDIRYEIEDINSKLNGNSAKIENIEQKLSDIFSAENKVTDFNTTTDDGIYYWITDAANKPGTDYGVLLVNKYDGGSNSLWINQIAYGTNNKIYFRQNINSGNWTEWKAVAFDGEITANKIANALTVNGETYDGSEAVDAGVQKIENGGTGVTTQEDINKAFIGNLNVGNDDVTDGTEFVSSYASDNGFADSNALNKPYKRQFVKVWNYIKGKISSVLGLTATNYSGKAATAGTADKTVNDITIEIPFSYDNVEYVIPFGNIPEPTSTAINSPYNWDITGFFSFIRGSGHNGSHLWFEAGHGYSHDWTTYAYLDKMDFKGVTTSIKAFQYEGKWWLGLCLIANDRGYFSKMTITYSRGLPAKPTCILYNSKSNGIVNEEIYNSIQDIPSSWWKTRTIINPTTFTSNITAPSIKATTNFTGNLTGISAKSSFLDEYVGAGGTRLTSGNIKPKDASEYGGMRKDVVTSSMTDSGRPNKDGHLLTMFWDNTGRYDSQFFVSNSTPLTLKARFKANTADYGSWTDIITSNNIGSQTVANATNARTNADAGYLCKLYQLAWATQTYNVILLGKIPDPASTEAPATPATSWDIDVDFYFVRAQGHKAAWCNVKAGYGYSNAWRKYGLIETFGVGSNRNYENPFSLVTLKYNNEYYIGVRHTVDIDGSYAARVKNVNTDGNKNPSTVNNTPLVNMLKVIPYQKTSDGTILNSEVKTSIADFPNTYAPAVERNGDLLLKSGYVKIGSGGVAGSKLTIQGATVSSNSYTDTNPKLEFKNNDESQNISLTFTDFDAVQTPASLTLNGNQGNEYFIAPNIKATTKFIGNLTGNVSGTATSAGKLTTARTAYVELGNANTNTTVDWSGTTTIPVNGVLSVEHGGTGATTAEAAANSLINNLPASDNVPVDTDYFISQHVNGGPFVPAYQRRPVSKLWEYIKGKILQEGEDFGYNHIVYDGDSLLEWANCTDGSMKKVLIKSGIYNITKSVNLTNAGTGYVFAEQGAEINSHVPIAFTATSGKTVIHNLSVVCDGAANGDNSCAFSADNPESLILYNCSATYRTYTEIVNRSLFEHCTCYNCSYAFQNLPANSSISVRVFYQCRCYNCKCSQTIEANSSTGISFYTESYFYKECHCTSCDAELTTSRNIKAATVTFACYYNCYDRCVGCLSKINVGSKALTVYSTLYGFLRCQYMSSCKETHTEGYSNIKGIVQCDFISSTSGINGGSNTHVGNSCNIQ